MFILGMIMDKTEKNHSIRSLATAVSATLLFSIAVASFMVNLIMENKNAEIEALNAQIETHKVTIRSLKNGKAKLRTLNVDSIANGSKRTSIKLSQFDSQGKSSAESGLHNVFVDVALDRNGAEVYIDMMLRGEAPCTLKVGKGIHLLKLIYRDTHSQLFHTKEKQIYIDGDLQLPIPSDKFIILSGN